LLINAPQVLSEKKAAEEQAEAAYREESKEVAASLCSHYWSGGERSSKGLVA
jgi:hypothetical protein